MGFLKKAGASLGIGALALVGGFGAGYFNQTDTSSFASQASVDLLKTQVATDHLVLGNLTVVSKDTQTTVNTIADEILADDMWEGAAEGLALLELQDKDYRELGRFVLNDLNATRDDVKDADLTVEIRDTDFDGMNTDRQDGTVVFDLRVRFDDNGDRVRSHVTATATIEDGEVTDLTFA